MKPIEESLDALRRLSTTADADLAEGMRTVAEQVQALIPDCVAISITMFESGLTFTLTATQDDFRLLDGVQYLDGGPCQESANTGDRVDVSDVAEETRWPLFTEASAALGIRSSLSVPLRQGSEVLGSLNLYGSSVGAFKGRERDIADSFGAATSELVADADLSMSTMARARSAPSMIEDADLINTAVGVLAQREGLDVEEARRRLLDASTRAGTNAAEIARLIVQPGRGDDVT